MGIPVYRRDSAGDKSSVSGRVIRAICGLATADSVLGLDVTGDRLPGLSAGGSVAGDSLDAFRARTVFAVRCRHRLGTGVLAFLLLPMSIAHRGNDPGGVQAPA